MPDGRAVILGGGGVTGIAWETGVLCGLADEGVDLGAADAIIGTSAGSFVGAALAGGEIPEYFERQLNDKSAEVHAVMSEAAIAGWQKAVAEGQDDPAAVGRALGRLALETPTMSLEARERVVASRLLSTGWPLGPLKMTAIDAKTGALHLFDKDSGVPITAAASASGAVPGLNPPIEALGRTWIDGGSCSSANVLLGASYGKVVVIAPVANGLPGRPGAADEFATLQAAGIPGILIVPNRRSEKAMGANPFDPSRRGGAAEAGRQQGWRLASDVRQIWERST